MQLSLFLADVDVICAIFARLAVWENPISGVYDDDIAILCTII